MSKMSKEELIIMMDRWAQEAYAIAKEIQDEDGSPIRAWQELPECEQQALLIVSGEIFKKTGNYLLSLTHGANIQ